MTPEEIIFKEVERFILGLPEPYKERVNKMIAQIGVVLSMDPESGSMAIAYIGAKLACQK
jgi:hypothetical protein